MTRAAIGVGFAAVMLLFGSGCGGQAAPKIASQADVAGTVNLDGKPMDEPEGDIAFVVGGQAPVRMPIKGGKFEGKGPIGDVRVEIRAWREGERAVMDGKPFGDPVKDNYIAPQFNDSSTLTAKIEAGGSKNLKFDVETKK
jgi:hypothetical protein